MLLASCSASAYGRTARATSPPLHPSSRPWQHQISLSGSQRWGAARRPCKGSEEDGQWDLDGELDKIINDEESQALLKDLKAAAERVAAAKMELDKLEKRTGSPNASLESLGAADSLVAEYEREVFAAEGDVRIAELALVKARAGTSVQDVFGKWTAGAVDEDIERIESGKAAAASAFVGTIASLPWSIAMVGDRGAELIVSAGLVFTSCALFGVTYRYAVRGDLGNTQLKAGCAAAFALVRGLSQIDNTVMLFGLGEGAMQKLSQCCLFAGESFCIFFFAAITLDYCFRQGVISAFHSRRE